MSFSPPNLDDPSNVPVGDIWGVICHVQGGEVESIVPPGFHVSAANDLAVSYISKIAAELARLPHRYGYDPETIYRVIVQTWDRALSTVKSLSFGRNLSNHQMVGLIPDAYYINSDGYSNLYTYGLRCPTWSQRSENVAWRGSVTGQGSSDSPADIPRVRLALACRDTAKTDVALIGVHETMHNVEPGLSDFLKKEGLIGARWPSQNFSYYKFTIDIDGHANAWGLLEKLILGCCVLKVASPYEQWFYNRLHPWEHYVPIAADLSDISAILQWCRDNEAHCEWIAANGARLAATVRLQAELPRSCLEFMKAAQAFRKTNQAEAYLKGEAVVP